MAKDKKAAGAGSLLVSFIHSLARDSAQPCASTARLPSCRLLLRRMSFEIVIEQGPGSTVNMMFCNSSSFFNAVPARAPADTAGAFHAPAPQTVSLAPIFFAVLTDYHIRYPCLRQLLVLKPPRL